MQGERGETHNGGSTRLAVDLLKAHVLDPQLQLAVTLALRLSKETVPAWIKEKLKHRGSKHTEKPLTQSRKNIDDEMHSCTCLEAHL